MNNDSFYVYTVHPLMRKEMFKFQWYHYSSVFSNPNRMHFFEITFIIFSFFCTILVLQFLPMVEMIMTWVGEMYHLT
jgi:hypothetical protein